MTKSRGIRTMNDRAAAKAAGEKYYQSMTPCKRGHVAKRLTSNGCCMACLALVKSAKDKAHYARNAEKIKAGVKKYRSQNIEAVSARDKEKWLRNHARNLELCKTRSARHSEKLRLNREYEAFLSRLESGEASA